MPPGTVDNVPSTDTAAPNDTIRDEHCQTCESIPPQRVTIEIRAGGSTHTAQRGTEKYSRGPYRVTECLRCNRSVAIRIDNR